MAPQGAWGSGVSSAFSKRWRNLGGRIVSQLAYDQNGDIEKSIKRVLGVDQSEKRHKSLQAILGDDLGFVPRRRQDADMIFLAALPAQGRQILPLLKYYYAYDIPVFSTSLIYAGTPSPQRDRDIDGVFFCDMPWVFTSSGIAMQRNHEQNAHLWSEGLNHYTRLYALGMDAYKLMFQLNRLSMFPEFGIAGATGTLYLSDDYRIGRELQWAQMRSGQPR